MKSAVPAQPQQAAKDAASAVTTTLDPSKPDDNPLADLIGSGRSLSLCLYYTDLFESNKISPEL